MRCNERWLATVVGSVMLMIISTVAVQMVSATTPSIYIRSETHQFRPVLEGTEIEHTFKIKNRGDAQLEILNVRTD